VTPREDADTKESLTGGKRLSVEDAKEFKVST
jgi:hypothetical protein